jgi:hypothetical protein
VIDASPECRIRLGTFGSNCIARRRVNRDFRFYQLYDKVYRGRRTAARVDAGESQSGRPGGGWRKLRRHRVERGDEVVGGARERIARQDISTGAPSGSGEESDVLKARRIAGIDTLLLRKLDRGSFSIAHGWRSEAGDDRQHACGGAAGHGERDDSVPEMEVFGERFGFGFVAHQIGDANRSARVERFPSSKTIF